MKLPKLKVIREDIILGGVIILLALFLTIILGDGYILYKSTQLKKGDISETAVTPLISLEDINEATKLLDEREQKFKELVNPVRTNTSPR